MLGTMGAFSNPGDVARLLRGGCALCGRAHSGFRREARLGIWLAACGCRAIYQYQDGAPTPASIRWYRRRARR